MERDLKKLVASMTLEEKAGMCSGADFLEYKGCGTARNSKRDDV